MLYSRTSLAVLKMKKMLVKKSARWEADLGGYHFPELILSLCFGPNHKVVDLLSAWGCFFSLVPFSGLRPLPVLGHFGVHWRVCGVCVCLKSLVWSLSICCFPLCQLKEVFLHHLTLTLQVEMKMSGRWCHRKSPGTWQGFNKYLFHGARSWSLPEPLMLSA